MKTLKLLLNVNIEDAKKGSHVIINVDADNVPLEYKWRRVLKDAQHDDCVVIVNTDIKKVGAKK